MPQITVKENRSRKYQNSLMPYSQSLARECHWQLFQKSNAKGAHIWWNPWGYLGIKEQAKLENKSKRTHKKVPNRKKELYERDIDIMRK